MRLKLGSIAFTNSLPVDLGILSGRVPVNADIVSDIPSKLNEAMLRGDLDVSPVSSLCYLENQERFVLLPELCISSGSAVESVLLISRKPLGELSGSKIAVTTKGRTTPALLGILLKEKIKITAALEVRDVYEQWPDEFSAIMVIGDEALRWKEKAAENSYIVWDLAEAWREWTGLPFVFALWVAARNVWDDKREEVLKIHEALLKSREWGLSHMDEVRRAALARTTLTEATVSSYFRRLSYVYGEEQKKGLELFCGKALKEKARFSESNKRLSVDDILSKALDGKRVSIEEGVRLYEEADIFELGYAANELNLRKNPYSHDRATFVVDRNINYTNYCYTLCKFCAFYRLPGDNQEGYLRSNEEIFHKIDELLAIGGTQVLLQGGHNPALGIEYYEDLVRVLHARYPQIHIHSFSASEVWHICKVSKMTPKQVLTRLKEAGLNSLPGGGAEILVDRVRQMVSPLKTKVSEYFEVHRAAHEIGLISTSTMVYGLGETIEERMMHFDAYRKVQDQTGGFRAFIPWSFESESTEMAMPRRTGSEYLRMVALSRIMLDNIQHVQAGWVTEGPKLSQIALGYGADDFGGILMEENVVSATKSDKLYSGVTKDEAIRLIREAGKLPVQRNTNYEIVRVFTQESGQVPAER